MQASNMVSSGEKNYNLFIGYKIKPVRVMLPKTNAYVKSYNRETNWMYFFIEDDELLEKYKDIWNRVSNNIKNLIGNPSTIKNF